MSDAELLARYLKEGSGEAFRALVERHAGMVHAACARGLGRHASLADDAAQAVFLVLSRKAASLRDPEALASWLFGIAHAVVANLLREEARRKRREEAAARRERSKPMANPDRPWGEALPHLNEAVAALREKQRAAVVLHYLEGVPQNEVAVRLGCTPAAVHERIAYGLETLRRFFARKGVVLTGAALAAGLTALAAPKASAGVAVACAAAGAGGGAVSAAAATAAQGTLKALFVAKVKAAVALVFCATAAAAGGGAAVRSFTAPDSPPPAAAVLAPSAPPQEAPPARPVSAVPSQPGGTLATSWVGNTFGAGKAKWVQNHILDTYVAPDGTVYTNSWYDEGHETAGVYRNGDRVGVVSKDGHAIRGYSVTGDGESLYIHHADLRRTNEIHRLKLGEFRSGKPWVTLEKEVMAYGMAAGKGELFVTDPAGDRVLVFSCADGRKAREFPFQRPGDIAMDKEGNLWIVQTDVSYKDAGEAARKTGRKGEPFRIVAVSREGKPLGREIADVDFPAGLSVDPQGRLLVADRGPKSQVLCYTGLSGSPRLDPRFHAQGAFGKPGGIRSGVPGEAAPDKLFDLMDAGIDDAGNLVVALSGPVPRNDGPNHNAHLRAFDPQGKPLWEVMCKMFVDIGDLDPESMDFFTRNAAFSLDLKKTAPGTEWRHKAVTFDPWSPWDDLRKAGLNGGGVYARRIGGKLFLFKSTNEKSPMEAYRFDPSSGLLAKPCLRLWVEGSHPKGVEKIWTDRNGDGRMSPDEVAACPYPSGGDPGYRYYWPDAEGSFWGCIYRGMDGLRRIRCTGLGKEGLPAYSFEPKETWTARDAGLEGNAGFNFLHYRPADDVMILGLVGNSTQHWDKVGVLARFDHWTRPDKRKKVWEIDKAHFPSTYNALSFDAAGDFVFVPGGNVNDWPVIHAFSMANGGLVGYWGPGPEVNSMSGWLDIRYPIRAHKTAGGEYLVFTEEDGWGKNLFYRWKPASMNALPVAELQGMAGVEDRDALQPLTLEARAEDRDGRVAKVEFVDLEKNAVLGSAAAAPYRLTLPPGAPGRYRLAARAVDDKGASFTSRAVVVRTGLRGEVVRAVNCGGGKEGSFEADSSFEGGSAGSHPDRIDLKPAWFPAPEAVYRCCRHDRKGFGYAFGGLDARLEYGLRLHFAYTHYGPVENGFVFDVTVNGRKVLEKYDPLKDVGFRKAGVREFRLKSDAGGRLAVRFDAAGAKEGVFCSGIEIVRLSK